MKVADSTWGGDVTTAAIAHLAHSTPARYLFSTTDFNSYVRGVCRRRAAAGGGAHGGLGRARTRGDPRMKLLGPPVVDVRRRTSAR